MVSLLSLSSLLLGQKTFWESEIGTCHFMGPLLQESYLDPVKNHKPLKLVNFPHFISREQKSRGRMWFDPCGRTGPKFPQSY